MEKCRERLNDCPCGGTFKAGFALVPTVQRGIQDFFTGDEGQTYYYGGPGRLIKVLKCERCGHSFTSGRIL